MAQPRFDARILWSTAIALSLLGCGESQPEARRKRCAYDYECRVFDVCYKGECDSPAGNDSPCRRDGTCSEDTNYTVDGKTVPTVCNPLSNVCEVFGVAGTPCLNDDTCLDDSLCTEAKVCEELRSDGEACTEDEQCNDTSHGCNLAGKCGMPEVGEPCDPTEDHACGGIGRLCLEGTCVEAHSVGRGEPCEVDKQCETGFCKDKVCDLSAEGESCGQCEDNLWCTAEHVCKRAPGQPCDDPAQCADTLECDKALDGSQRCVHTTDTSCGLTPLGDFSDVCTGDCQTLCRACFWEITPDGHRASCVDSCASGDTICSGN